MCLYNYLKKTTKYKGSPETFPLLERRSQFLSEPWPSFLPCCFTLPSKHYLTPCSNTHYLLRHFTWHSIHPTICSAILHGVLTTLLSVSPCYLNLPIIHVYKNRMKHNNCYKAVFIVCVI